MNYQVLVTGYEGPDLDGVACSVAYAEFLRTNDVSAIAGAFGTPHREAQFVMDQVGVNINWIGDLDSSFEEIRLVDASDKRGISDQIEPSTVTEVIDHRKDYDQDAFPNAELQIELVGAAATLIGEKFEASNVVPSEEIATLLYTAIISNTLNLQANVTTERDERMVSWLADIVDIPEDVTDRMFEYKSDIDTGRLEAVFENDFAIISENDARIGIVQLEIVEVEEFVCRHRGGIEAALKSIRDEKELDGLLLVGVDVRKGYDVLLSHDEDVVAPLERSLDVSFSDHIAITERPIMRKELIPELRDAL